MWTFFFHATHCMTGRNYGYAKFASKDCAKKAIETLHGQTLAGQKLKVLEAEPPKTYQGHPGAVQGEEGPSKKQKLWADFQVNVVCGYSAGRF